MSCPVSSHRLRRFTHMMVTSRAEVHRSFPLEPCTCEPCHIVAMTPTVYEPGCKCPSCKLAHRVLLELVDAHDESVVMAYASLASGWAASDDARLYKEVRRG